MNPRRLLLELFDSALRAVHGRVVVARFLESRVTDPRIEVLAIGKAASAMALGARDAMKERIARILVITKTGHSDPALDGPAVLQVESAHPLPDRSSLESGALLEARLRDPLPGALPLFLVSGGSSSLVECLREGASLDALQALNSKGLSAGWDIVRLNRERANLSRIKGGGIARMLEGRRAVALFISDVAGDDPEVIGSGLLGRGGRDDAVERHVVANVELAVSAVTTAAQHHGLRLEAAPRFDGPAEQVARRFVDELRSSPADGLVWGGESTVSLCAQPGRGGRNQHLALCAALAMRAHEPLSILAAGTDGTDGPTDDAGAMVDSGTVERAELAGVDVQIALRQCASGLALEAAGDLVHTGPTGTNVGDILIGIKRPLGRDGDLATPRMV
jgi:glycerate 2-kinase